MTTEPSASEALSPAPEPLDPKPYTHITLTFREPLEGTQPVEGTVTIELEQEAWPEDVVDWETSDAPPAPKTSVDDPNSSDVTIYRDDMEDLYEAIEKALTEAGREAVFDLFDGGNVFVLAHHDVDGKLVMTHTLVSDGLCYLEDAAWVTSWRFHYGE